ncbi:MAG: hypothetical protein F6K41_33950 [Symploca sp. SIO3E6]|nr:hypothetical protein [Caldora sp. SIO3E6]
MAWHSQALLGLVASTQPTEEIRQEAEGSPDEKFFFSLPCIKILLDPSGASGASGALTFPIGADRCIAD